jgi:hypothetical protein
MGRRSVPTDLVRNIELLVGVALPLFLTGVWLQDHLTGSGHWAHPIESGFFEWLSLVPLLAFVGLVHSVGMAAVAAVWPRAATRTTSVIASVLLVPLLVLAGRPLNVLARYALPLGVALLVYAMASRIPGGRQPPEEDVRTAPLSEDELLGHHPESLSPPVGAPSVETPAPRARPPQQLR